VDILFSSVDLYIWMVNLFSDRAHDTVPDKIFNI